MHSGVVPLLVCTNLALFINNGVQKLTMNVIYSLVILQGQIDLKMKVRTTKTITIPTYKLLPYHVTVHNTCTTVPSVGHTNNTLKYKHVPFLNHHIFLFGEICIYICSNSQSLSLLSTAGTCSCVPCPEQYYLCYVGYCRTVSKNMLH